MLQELIDEDQATMNMHEEPQDDTNIDATNIDARADTGELPPELRPIGDAEYADETEPAVTVEIDQDHDNDNSDNNDDQDDHSSTQITYIIPGKRRRTNTHWHAGTPTRCDT